MIMAVLMVAAMWVFPEAGVKKGDARRKVATNVLANSSASRHGRAQIPAMEPSITTVRERVFHAALLRASSAL